MTSQMLDVGVHERRRERRMQDPQYRAAYERAAREAAQTDAVIRQLDSLRAGLGISKAALARRVNRNASSVRRLFTAGQVRPGLEKHVLIPHAGPPGENHHQHTQVDAEQHQDAERDALQPDGRGLVGGVPGVLTGRD